MMEEKDTNSEQQWHHVVTIDDAGGLMKKINITYDAVGVDMALKKACEVVAKNVQLKGFRKGKAPLKMVEISCSKEIKNQAANMLSQEGFFHACYEQKIQPLGRPELKSADFNIDGTFSCEINIEVKPLIIPTGYVGMQLTKRNSDPEEIFNAIMENAKKQHSSIVHMPEVIDGCTITVDFKVSRDDKEISSGIDQQFNITQLMEPPFGKNLIGVKVGESIFENFLAPDGNSSLVSITVKEAFSYNPPTDEELAQKMQAPSLEDLISVMKKHAANEAMKRDRQFAEEEVVDKLVASNEFEVSKQWVDDEEKYLLQQFGYEVKDESVAAYFRKMAERNVRRAFILDAIYDTETSLVVKKEEFDQVVENESMHTGVPKEVIEKEIKDKKMLDAIIETIKQRKVFDFIIGQAQFVSSETEQFVKQAVSEGE